MSTGSLPPPPEVEAPTRTATSWRRRLLTGTGALIVLALVAGAAVVGYGWWRISQIGHVDVALAKSGDKEPKNYLVVGSDSRDVVDASDPNASAFIGDDSEPAGKRSDTIMVVRVDPIAGTIDIVSFPRDLWLPIARTDGRERINTAYGYDDGPQRLIDTISQNFGIEINHYIEVDFRSFKGVVDAIHGVPMYFDKAMRDTNSGLYIDQPGCVTLDGEQALAFSRSRHLQYRDSKGRWQDDPTGDLGRISRQQVFMRKVVDRAGAETDGFNVKSMLDLVSAVAPNLTTDPGLDIPKLLNLKNQFKEFSGENLRTHTLPVEQFSTAGGASVLRLDEVAAQPILDIFRPPKESIDSTSRAAASLVVQNGSGVSGQAGQASKAFQAMGFTVTSTGDAPKRVSHTLVRYAPDSQVSATEIARMLANGADIQQDDTLGSGQLVVVTGSDFKVPTTPPGTGSPSGTSGTSGTSRTNGTTGTTVAPSGTAVTPTTEPEAVGVVPGEAPDGVSCD